jgi:catechol 2,3-dioxygenase-like lactoylglutathione lyase family enzyme
MTAREPEDSTGGVITFSGKFHAGRLGGDTQTRNENSSASGREALDFGVRRAAGPSRFARMKITAEHLGVPALNPTALKDWYVKVLGAELRYENVQTPPAYFVGLGDGLMLEIYQGTSASEETTNNNLAGWRHLALHVESVAAARELLESRGVKFTDPVKPAGGGGRILFFRDCENNLLHLVERPKDSIFYRP